ncbi:hypothetical protein K439DRAFT_1617221 [Ramaria rubella]|nr:hypothetical protein K439DRAFT_1617221 [Ramaria rubella]
MTVLKEPCLNFLSILALHLEGIGKYNECRHQAFECWCGLLLPEVPVFVKLKKIGRGSYAICHEFLLDEKLYTCSMTADYPVFNKNGATMPASSPTSVSHAAGGQSVQHTRRCSTLSHLARGSKSAYKLSMPSSPPSASRLLQEVNHEEPTTPTPVGCTRNHTLAHLMSLTSSTSSMAAEMMHGRNLSLAGSSSQGSSRSAAGEEQTHLQFCDNCFVAYSVERFARDICHH